MEEVNITWKHYTNKFENSSDMNNLEHTNFCVHTEIFPELWTNCAFYIKSCYGLNNCVSPKLMLKS